MNSDGFNLQDTGCYLKLEQNISSGLVSLYDYVLENIAKRTLYAVSHGRHNFFGGALQMQEYKGLPFKSPSAGEMQVSAETETTSHIINNSGR